MSVKEFGLCLLFGVAGGLIGYGHYGTVQALCYGAGIGLIVYPVATIVLAIVDLIP